MKDAAMFSFDEETKEGKQQAEQREKILSMRIDVLSV